MKKIALLAMAMVFVIQLNAQEDSNAKQREVGLTFQNLDNYGLTYRFGKNNKLWRLNAATGGITIGKAVDIDSTDRESNSYAFSISVGREHRKPIVNKLDFRYGLDLIGSFGYSKVEQFDNTGTKLNDQEITNISGGTEFLIGVNYKISEHFVFGAVITPGLVYSFGETRTQSASQPEYKITSDTWSFGFKTSVARLSLVYAFS